MKSLILPVAVLLLAACSSSRKAETAAPAAPDVQLGRVDRLWQVLDGDTRQRVGFVEKTVYDQGLMLYLVRGPDRGPSLGYIQPNNVAYRYVWIGGKRSQEHENLGADTITAGARRILGYDRPVTLDESSLDALLAERRAASEPKQEPVAEGDAEE
jgi:hypothetical protein